ncbi:Stress responsive A/B Barrel Domain [Lotmaria passim]
MQHVVFFKLDPEKFAAEFPGDSIYEDFETMRRANIPGLLEFNFSAKNTTAWEGYQDATQGYTHAFISRHTDAEALHIFADHPDHKVLQLRVFKCLAAPPLRMELNWHPPAQ